MNTASIGAEDEQGVDQAVDRDEAQYPVEDRPLHHIGDEATIVPRLDIHDLDADRTFAQGLARA